MDSALVYAYMFDLGWFVLLTGVLMLVATALIIFLADSWETRNYQPEKQVKG